MCYFTQTQCLLLLSHGKHKFCSPSLATLFQACPLQDTQLPPKCVVSVCRCLLAKVAHTLSPCSPHRKKSHGVRSASSCGSPSVRLNESRCSADAYLGVHVRLHKNGGWYDRKLPEVLFFLLLHASFVCIHFLCTYGFSESVHFLFESPVVYVTTSLFPTPLYRVCICGLAEIFTVVMGDYNCHYESPPLPHPWAWSICCTFSRPISLTDTLNIKFPALSKELFTDGIRRLVMQ